ncbi:ABC transporter ATP-binding protein [Limnoglobus roseus]|uniref:ABC transporter ATP-binding protein n=1 Tax=Limnoglobus roseus TaxID=2598579 RepID=A0A5C1A533_9BACT|nr:ABC transporter ATP-binding protein [Limnoglobus roseus]QEL13507.1 ABC transporter ATP-binding protein [Limnoglobus roseus]
MTSNYLSINGLIKSYPPATGKGDRLVIVDGFDLHVDEGEFITLIGHSGCGKSTVLMILAGLSTQTEGVITLGGNTLTGPGLDRGIVFQSPCLLPWLTAFENVMLSVDQGKPDWKKAERRDHAMKYLSLVGLQDAVHKKPAELSQGMRQRVGIARAFALQPKLLLLDEPFGMLDSLTRIELQQVLLDIWTQERMTAVMVTHDIDEAIFMADRVVMMTNGPRAKIGDIVPVPFARPRSRGELLESNEFYALRERLVGFLEELHHDHAPKPEPEPTAATPASPKLVTAPLSGNLS